MLQAPSNQLIALTTALEAAGVSGPSPTAVATTLHLRLSLSAEAGSG